MKLGNRELALAMELRAEGCTWKIIARGLGVSPLTLPDAVKKAKREGMRESKRIRSTDYTFKYAGREASRFAECAERIQGAS